MRTSNSAITPTTVVAANMATTVARAALGLICRPSHSGSRPVIHCRITCFVISHQERTALIQLCDTSHWRSVVGLTLNLKQCITTVSGGFIRLDELSAKKTFRRYVNGLNRQVYGSAYRHHGKRLRVIPILESLQTADGITTSPSSHRLSWTPPALGRLRWTSGHTDRLATHMASDCERQ